MFIKCALVWALALCAAVAAENPVAWSITNAPKKPVKPGDAFTLRLVAEIQPGWHVYSIDQSSGGPIATEISLAGGQPFEPAASVEGPKPLSIFDSNFDMRVAFYAGKAAFRVPVKTEADAPAGKWSLLLEARYQCCNDKLCLPPKTVKLEAPVEIAGR
jgi:hypothetical protein